MWNPLFSCLHSLFDLCLLRCAPEWIFHSSGSLRGVCACVRFNTSFFLLCFYEAPPLGLPVVEIHLGLFFALADPERRMRLTTNVFPFLSRNSTVFFCCFILFYSSQCYRDDRMGGIPSFHFSLDQKLGPPGTRHAQCPSRMRARSLGQYNAAQPAYRRARAAICFVSSFQPLSI
jgi:hypothetical protein